MFKHFIIRNLHSLLGFENYLFTFTLFKISTLKHDNRKKEFVYFTKLFRRDANVIVIGANTGITTIPIAKNVLSGKVFAFEPIDQNYKTLLRIIDYFNFTNIETYNIALGNKNTEIEMVMPVVDNTRSHGLCHIDDGSVPAYEQGIKFRVLMKKLDDIFKSFEGKLDGIKIVAENYEWFIFDGAKEIINKHRPLIYCELWFNEQRQKVLKQVHDWDYDIKVLENEKLIDYNPEQHHTKNLFFVPAGVKYDLIPKH
ncbi:MAG: FkbM family methyltransferase [Ignavibacteria bacterium]